MLFVINGNIVEGIQVNHMGCPIFPDELQLNSCGNNNEWPYIYIPSFKSSTIAKCEIGYWDNIHLTKRITPIVCGSVSILSINVKREIVQHYESGLSIPREEYELFYHYEITLQLNDGNKTCNYTFNSEDYLEIYYGRRTSQKIFSMKCLFNKIIPLLNEYVSKNNPIDLLNYFYVQSFFPKKDDNYVQNEQIHHFESLRKIIYSAKMRLTKGVYYLELGEGIMEFVNRYVAGIFSNILGVQFVRDNNNRCIYCDISSLSSEIDDSNLLMYYCLAKLFFNAERFYSYELANKEILLSVPLELSDSPHFNTELDLYNPTMEVTKMFDFIFNIKAKHKHCAEYRVGRDDHEWDLFYIGFPLRDKYVPSEKLISLIEKTLNIKLDLNNSKFESEYSYSRIENSESVPWLAREEDLGSNELKESSKSMVFNRIYEIFKSDRKGFNSLAC